MANIEQVIRHALEKIDTSNDELREQVYRAVWESHERSIIADLQLTDEDRAALRDQLVALIQSMEEEYHLAAKQDALKAEEEAVASSQNQAIDDALDNDIFRDEQIKTSDVPLDPVEQNFSPDYQEQDSYQDLQNDGGSEQNQYGDKDNLVEVEVAEVISGQDNPSSQGPEELGPAPVGGLASRLPKRHTWWRSNLVLMVLLVLLVLVAYAFYNSLTSVPSSSAMQNEASNPPPTVGEQSQSAQSEGWITVFDPMRISDFSIQGSATAQIKGEGVNRALRFSGVGTDDKVVITIGEGVIEQLRGKTVTFNVVARSANDANAQIALTCDFGIDNSCGKRNFDLSQTREDLLFSVDIPQTVTKDGKLFLQSALVGPNYEIDIFAIRVRIEN